MPMAEINKTINRPIHEVFAYVVDIKHLPDWIPVIQDAWPTSAEQDKVGATYVT